MLSVLALILQTAFKLVKEHPDLAEALLGKAASMLIGVHDDAGAQAGLAQGLAALASSAATSAREREKRRSADAEAARVAAHTLPLAEDFPLQPGEAGPARPEIVDLVAAINRALGAELVAVAGPQGGTMEALSTTKESAS